MEMISGNSMDFCECSDWKAIYEIGTMKNMMNGIWNIGIVNTISNMKLFIRLLHQFRFYCLISGWGPISKNLSMYSIYSDVFVYGNNK